MVDFFLLAFEVLTLGVEAASPKAPSSKVRGKEHIKINPNFN